MYHSDKYMKWCLERNIKVLITPINRNTYVLTIDNNGEKKQGKNKYNSKNMKWGDAVREVYKKLYLNNVQS